MDTTDLPLHGKQEGRFFHGYYDNYCYLPLYIFCGEHVLCARLREANHDAAFGSLQEIRRIVGQIRVAWPEVNIVLRGDSGFCRNELMSWCENNGVKFVFGLARNQRLRKIIGAQMQQATQQWNQTGKPARVFSEFHYKTKKKANKGGWDGERRVVAKAEHIDGKENPRFVVTSLTSGKWAAQALYEQLYCACDLSDRLMALVKPTQLGNPIPERRADHGPLENRVLSRVFPSPPKVCEISGLVIWRRLPPESLPGSKQ